MEYVATVRDKFQFGDGDTIFSALNFGVLLILEKGWGTASFCMFAG